MLKQSRARHSHRNGVIDMVTEKRRLIPPITPMFLGEQTGEPTILRRMSEEGPRPSSR